MVKKQKRKQNSREEAAGTGVNLFLREGTVPREEKPYYYDLGEEFAKARKNRGLFLYGIIALFLALVLTGTYFMTLYIKEQTSRITIDISDFEDLNLAELIALARDAEKNIGKIAKDMEFLRSKMSAELGVAAARASRQIEAIKASGRFSEERKNEMIRKIREDQAGQIAAVKSQYSSRMSEREKELSDMKKNLDNYQVQAKKNQENYESRMGRKLQEYEKQIAANQTKTAELLKSREKLFSEQMDRERGGYDREIKKLTAERDELLAQMNREREKSLAADTLLRKYRSSVMALTRRAGEHGYVIDAARESEMRVELNPYYPVKKGQAAYVVDRKNAVIAMVELVPADAGARARVTRKIKNVPIQPFDMILLKLD